MYSRTMTASGLIVTVTDIGDNADVDADGNGYADCPVGTTEVEDNLCLIPSEVRTDLTLTYLASIDMQQA
jgi:hypothetical protein